MATTTPNYGWTVPTSTDLVKDGATAIETLGDAVDATVFANASAAIAKTIVDAKGDLIAATAADTVSRLASSGVNGEVLTVDTTTSTGLKWSAPASTGGFTQRLAEGGGQIHGITYNGSNLYVAFGVAGVMWTSPDAITWTTRTSGFGANAIYSVAFGNSLWVAVGENGTITTSPDGTTWTARTSNMSTNVLNRVIYANSLYVVVGDGGGAANTGGVAYSSDGFTWTRKSMTPTIGQNYYDIAYNGTNFIVTADWISPNNYLYASTPSGTWTAAQAVGATSEVPTWIIYDGTRTYFQYGSNALYYTTSTTLASAVLVNQVGAANLTNTTRGRVIFYGTKLYISNVSYYVSVTVASSANPLRDWLGFAPTTSINTSTFTGRNNAIWVGAAGTIFASTSGGIWTSF